MSYATVQKPSTSSSSSAQAAQAAATSSTSVGEWQQGGFAGGDSGIASGAATAGPGSEAGGGADMYPAGTAQAGYTQQEVDGESHLTGPIPTNIAIANLVLQ